MYKKENKNDVIHGQAAEASGECKTRGLRSIDYFLNFKEQVSIKSGPFMGDRAPACRYQG